MRERDCPRGGTGTRRDDTQSKMESFVSPTSHRDTQCPTNCVQSQRPSVPLERLRSATPPTDRRPPTAFQRTDTKTRTATDKETALNTQLLRTATPRAVQTQKAEHAAPTPDAARDGAQTTGRDGQTRGHGRPRFRGPPRWVAAALHGVRSRGTAPTRSRNHRRRERDAVWAAGRDRGADTGH